MIDPTELLAHIKKTETPPYLFGNIMYKIAASDDNYIVPVRVYLMAASFALLMAVNFFAVNRYSETLHQQNLESVAKSLSTNNQLY